MRDPWKVLGLKRDATLPDVKRAYARALKQNRPDDDPEAFARVHEAFEACMARVRQREAAARDDAPAWEEDEAHVPADAPAFEAWVTDVAGREPALPDAAAPAVEREAAPAAVPVDAIDATDAAHDEEDAAPDPVSEAVEAILAAAETQSPWDFDAFLRADERLYDLRFKRAVGDRVIQRAAYAVDELPWRTLGTIFHFFEVDSISDRRLRGDYMAREAWLQVQGDLRFDQELRAKRARNTTWADRVVMAELFDAPDARRHRMLHLVPMLAGKLRGRFYELAAEDAVRAEAALSPQARDYWLPVMDLSRLHWRRVAMALGQSLLATLPLASLVALGDDGLAAVPPVWATLAAVVFVSWLLFALSGVVRARYAQWRMRTVGAGDAPAGASMLADRPTAVAGAAAIVSLILTAVALGAERGTTGLLVQVWMVMLMVSSTFRAPPRLRWEAMLSGGAVALFAYPLLDGFATAKVENAFLPVSIGAMAVGILALLLVDAAHARQTRQALADVRDVLSIPQCVLAGVAAVAALPAWLLPQG